MKTPLEFVEYRENMDKNGYETIFFTVNGLDHVKFIHDTMRSENWYYNPGRIMWIKL